jgi:hypothetical protein
MHNAGAKIYVAIYLNKSLYIVNYDRLAYAKMLAGQKSVHANALYEWRIKDGIDY